MSATETGDPGPRQTVDRVDHPQRGPGVVVYDHGPSFFRPDGGPPIPIPPPGWHAHAGGSFAVLRDPDHGVVEARVTRAGAVHRRRWTPLLGAGWLVSGADRWRYRFEGDDGRCASFDAAVIAVGTPAYVARARTRRSRPLEATAEEQRWITYTCRDGTVLAFRDAPPDGPPLQAPKARQGSLFG